MFHFLLGLHDEGYLTDLEFDMEAVKPSQRGSRLVQELSSTVRKICAQSADQQQVRSQFSSSGFHLIFRSKLNIFNT